ncbi:MAG TPA: response regulator, partial [Limnobacter sp.]|nr:response regulator [Limnobacter sp.]
KMGVPFRLILSRMQHFHTDPTISKGMNAMNRNCRETANNQLQRGLDASEVDCTRENIGPSRESRDDNAGLVRDKPNVLLVEDNPINQDAASLLLTEMGCLVDVAYNGVQALEKFLRRTYDLILMDCQMPLMDGLTATSRIRSHELKQRLRRTPIVAITANVHPSDRQVCLDAGMDDYLPKPFKHSQLKGVLQRFLNTLRDA